MIKPSRLIVVTVSLICCGSVMAKSNSFYKHDVAINGGYSDNVYRTPDQAYVDWNQGPASLVVPNVQSGFFTDLKYKLDGVYLVSDKLSVLTNAKLGGRFYLDSGSSNANETKYSLGLGAERQISSGSRNNQVIKTLLVMESVNKTYYDRDTGLEKTAGITDVSDRYSFRGTGIEIGYKNKNSNRFGYSAGLAMGGRDYTDTVENSQMDYDYVVLSAGLKYKLQDSTKLKLIFKNEIQDYDDRPSRDLNGRLFINNPKLEYNYRTLGIGFRHKINMWTIYGDYRNITRDDRWVGYNDYTAHKLKVRLIHKVNDTQTKIAFATQTRDYPSAIAFDKLVNGARLSKTYDVAKVSFTRAVAQTKYRSFWAKVSYNNTETNDTRYKYDQFMLFAGYKWKL